MFRQHQEKGSRQGKKETCRSYPNCNACRRGQSKHGAAAACFSRLFKYNLQRSFSIIDSYVDMAYAEYVVQSAPKATEWKVDPEVKLTSSRCPLRETLALMQGDVLQRGSCSFLPFISQFAAKTLYTIGSQVLAAGGSSVTTCNRWRVLNRQRSWVHCCHRQQNNLVQ